MARRRADQQRLLLPAHEAGAASLSPPAVAHSADYGGGLVIPIASSRHGMTDALQGLVRTNPEVSQLVIDTGGVNPPAVHLLSDAAREAGLRIDLQGPHSIG